MRTKRRSGQPTSRPGRHRATRPRRRPPLLGATLAVAAALAPVASAPDLTSPTGPPAVRGNPPVEMGSGIVDAAVRPYVDARHLRAVAVGPEQVAGPVRMVLTGARVTTALDESGIPDVALEA